MKGMQLLKRKSIVSMRVKRPIKREKKIHNASLWVTFLSFSYCHVIGEFLLLRKLGMLFLLGSA